MVRLETTLIDRFISGSFAGKRVIGSPLKYNIKTKSRNQGWIEMVFHPQGRVEEFLSKAIRFIHPYLFYVTLRFHAEKAREGGKFFVYARGGLTVRGSRSEGNRERTSAKDPRGTVVRVVRWSCFLPFDLPI